MSPTPPADRERDPVAQYALPTHDRDGAPLRVVVLTGAGCHLCEVAEAIVARVCAEERATWAHVELSQAAPQVVDRRRAAYGELIPVVFVDGREHAHWHVDAEALRAALSPRRRRRIRDFVQIFTKS